MNKPNADTERKKKDYLNASINLEIGSDIEIFLSKKESVANYIKTLIEKDMNEHGEAEQK